MVKTESVKNICTCRLGITKRNGNSLAKKTYCPCTKKDAFLIRIRNRIVNFGKNGNAIPAGTVIGLEICVLVFPQTNKYTEPTISPTATRAESVSTPQNPTLFLRTWCHSQAPVPNVLN